MSLNALGIMLKPLLAKYIEPLEENGTIAKLQRDIELIAASNALPELATLVSELQTHNRLMQRLFDLIEGAATHERTTPDPEPRSDTGTAGLIGDHRDGVLDVSASY